MAIMELRLPHCVSGRVTGHAFLPQPPGQGFVSSHLRCFRTILDAFHHGVGGFHGLNGLWANLTKLPLDLGGAQSGLPLALNSVKLNCTMNCICLAYILYIFPYWVSCSILYIETERPL